MAIDGSSILILDGALGTELERRGVNLPLPLWTAEALRSSPDQVRAIHKDYVRAGADVLTAATFRTTRYALEHAGLGEKAEALVTLAISLAREAILECKREGVIDGARAEAMRVAGSLAPLEDCYQSELCPDDETLLREHSRTAKLLKKAGANMILVETQNSAREAQIATECALNVDLPVWCSLMARSATELWNGDSLIDAAMAAYALGVDAVLVNCCPPETAAAALRTLRQALPVGELPLGAYPNFGTIGGQPWEYKAVLSPGEFAEWGVSLSGEAEILGGCCGTTPDHIAALAKALRKT